MKKRKKVFFAIIIVCIIILVGGIFMVYNNNKDTEKEAPIRTDIEPIINRFPNLGNFEKCYWKADIVGNEKSKKVPGPTGYWMKGFIELDEDNMNTFIDKYNMEEINVELKPEFTPDNFDISTSFWLYSDEFNDYIKSPGFLGKFYIDNTNQYIYFEVWK